jgi:hypothetical protein
LKNDGCNPWPVLPDNESRCCDDCNENAVIPTRLTMIAEWIKTEKEESIQ